MPMDRVTIAHRIRSQGRIATAWLALLASFCSPVHAAVRRSGRPGRVQPGIDVLEAQKFAPLRGKHVGLITNHTGLDSQGRSTIEVLSRASGMHLVELFSPEHGLAGRFDEQVPSSRDNSTGLPLYSLYGDTLRPTDDMLKGIDALVFDVQDAGVRFYTYTTTMAYCMEEAAKRNIAFFVLDRPNPLGGNIVEGPMLDAGKTSFVGYFPLPIRYALTIRELDQLCSGVAVRITARAAWRSMRMGVEIAAILRKLYAAQFDPGKLLELTGDAETVRLLQENTSPEKIVASWSAGLAAFDQMRKKYFLYK